MPESIRVGGRKATQMRICRPMQNDPTGWGGAQQGWDARAQAFGPGAVQQAYAPSAGWGASTAPASEPPASIPTFGDRAGEYLHMHRGRYDATVYVFFAFLFQMGLVGLLVGGIPALVLGAVSGDEQLALGAFLILGIPAGIAGAYFTFRDRWKCIEAYSSRFCSGLMNLSLLYVPIIALVYANVRGIQKLAGR